MGTLDLPQVSKNKTNIKHWTDKSVDAEKNKSLDIWELPLEINCLYM